jgi:Ca2+-binding RTX toxin-like protein
VGPSAARRLFVPVALLLALLAPAPAAAVATCSYSPAAATVTITIGAANDTLNLDRDGTAIQFSGNTTATQHCGAATVRNTDLIQINAPGAGQHQTVDIFLTNGRFAPGKTSESSGRSEIEIQTNLGSGTDSLFVHGGPDANDFRLGAAGLNLNADGDKDITPGGVDQWYLYGDAGGDRLDATGGAGTGLAFDGVLQIYGGLGNDTLLGPVSRCFLLGQEGADRMTGGPQADSLQGGPGADRLNGLVGPDALYGGPGNDVVSGGDGVDYLYGESTADGADDFAGGGGNDFLYFVSRTGGMVIDLDGRADDGLPGEGDNARPDIESIFSGSGNDKLTGDDGPDFLNGGGGTDTISGRGGNDQLSGGFADLVGNTVNGGEGEDVVQGGDGADALTGGPGEDTLQGFNGVDVVNGGPGDDQLDEGAAANGGDNLIGGSGFDAVFYSQRATALTINMNDTPGDGAAGENDNVRSDVETVYGGTIGDTFTGNSAGNTFYGGGGNDVASGGDGMDTLTGDAGNDNLTGGLDFDFLNGGANTDTLNAIDGGHDNVNGGTEADTCNVDAGLDSVSECP